MKKLLLSIAFIAIASTVSAQLMQSSIWTTTKYAFQPRFEQMVDLSYDNILTYDHDSFTISYIAGYRFGYHLFVGGGLGFNFTINPGYQNAGSYDYIEYRTTNTLSVPIFAYVRTYFTKSKHSPFFALAIGGRISTSRDISLQLRSTKFSTCGLLLNPQIGMSHYISNSIALYYAIGLSGQTYPEFTDVTSTSLEIKSAFNIGVRANFGITF